MFGAAINDKNGDISEVEENELSSLEEYVKKRLVTYQQALIDAFIIYRSSNVNAL